ncbi:MAG TPA: HD domain-containing phosphohydrolase, partial [Acidobacteriota bacterium]|nr:HD domain-containing phosphohydrolase [Acidobacteriota bacterium]
LLGSPPLFRDPGTRLLELMLPMCAMTLVHYLSNSGGVAVIIALDSRRSIYRVWVKNFRWTFITYLTGATVASLIAVNVTSLSPAVLVATIPIILITYFTYNTYKEKIEGHAQRIRDLSQLYLRTVESLALAVDAKDQSTYGHVRRVRAYAMGLAKLRGIVDADELLAIETGSLLHDIGKLAVDDYILNKPGRLSEQEFKTMKTHTTAGEEILNHVQFPYPVAKIVRSHHERWDGTGYPDGLVGEQIPLGARILMIADTYDALRSLRPYKTSNGIDESVEELRKCSGSMYDPGLVELFIKNLVQLEAEATEAVKSMPGLSFRARSGNLDSGVAPMDTGIAFPASPSEEIAELISLAEFCGGVANHLSFGDLLVNLESRLKRLLPFVTCAFFFDSGDGSLSVGHAGGKYAEMLRGFRIGLGVGVSGWVAAYGKPMINARAHLEFQGLPEEIHSMSLAMAVPLHSEGTCIGTISLYADASVTYTEHHLKVLQTFTNQILPALANARGRASSESRQDFLDPVIGTYRTPFLSFAGTELIASCAKNASHFSLLSLDLQNYSEISEHQGQRMADTVLRKVAEILKSEIRERDVLVRFGQQGLVALLDGVNQELVSHRARAIAQQIANSEFDSGQNHWRMGTASYPEDGNTIFAILDKSRQTLQSVPSLLEARLEPDQSKVLEFTAS